MAATKKLQVEIVGDAKDLERAFGKAGKATDKFEGKTGRARAGLLRMGKAAKVGAVGVGVAGVAGAVKFTNAASDLSESLNKASATFEKSAPKVEAWSKTTAKGLGLSQAAALEGASSIGAMLKPMGVAAPTAAKMSVRMTELASDMASFNNQDPSEMLERLRSGLSGESEPLKQFGTVVSATRVKMYAYKNGIAETGAELTEAQKIQARYGLILSDTKDQQGDFARTSDGLANQQRILSAQFEDTSAKIGKVLLPAATKGLQGLNRFVSWASENWPKFQAYAERAFSGVQEKVDQVWTWLEANVVPSIVAISADVQETLEALRRYWDRWGDEIMAVVRGVFAVLGPFVKGAITQIKATIGFILAVLRGDWGKAWDNLKTLAINPFKTMAAEVKAILTKLAPALGKLALSVGLEVARNVWRGIKAGPLGQVSGWIRDKVTGGFAALERIASTTGSRIGKGLTSSLKTAVNLGAIGPPNVVIRALNALIGKVSSLIPFVDFPKIPQIEKFAEGGVVRGPTLAMIGEAGTEVVIPVGSKRKKEGRSLLSVAAAMLGAPGDVPGRTSGGGAVRRAQELGIPMFERGGVVIGGRAIGPNPGMMDALIRHQAKDANERNLWEKVGSFFARGLGSVIGKIPAGPRVGGPIFSAVGPAVRAMAVHYVRGLFSSRDKFAIGRIDEAKQWARAQMGHPYVWGGGHGGWNFSLPGYDCSGFSSHAAKKAGASLGSPGTTMSIFPMTKAIRSGGAPMYWGFRGMGGGPRQQHMGTKIYGTWYQFGNPGHTGGTDSQWTHLRAIPGLGGFLGGSPYLPSSGPIMAHKGEAVLPPTEAAQYRARGGVGGPLIGKLADTVVFTNPADVEVVTSDLARKVVTRLAAA